MMKTKDEKFMEEFNKIDFHIVSMGMMKLRIPQPPKSKDLEKDRLFATLYRTYKVLHYYGEYQRTKESRRP